MIAGNLYTKQQNAKKTLKGSFILKAILFASILLYSVPSMAVVSYNNGSSQFLTACKNSSAISINSFLTASGGSGTYTWSVISFPANGTLTGFPATAAAGPNVSPSGTTYQPISGFTGTDAFIIQVSDGSTSANTTINVSVYPVPDVSNFSISATNPCQGSGSSVTITSTSLAAGTYNVTYNIFGANSATGVVGSVTMASNTGTFTTSALANSGGTSITITAITNPCASTSVSSGNTAAFTVLANPASISVPGSVCVGSTMTVSDASGGGTWTSSNISLATVGSTGLVTGVGAGNPVITYTLGSGCFSSTPITVNATPNAITGTSIICTGTNTTLGETTTGGTWGSSNPSLASVTSTGIVTGIAAGSPTISYTLTAGGCFALFPMTINTTPGANTGTAVVCTGLTTTLGNGTSGGNWTSSNTGQATVGSSSGIVTGIAAGNPNITYTVPSGCYAITTVTVNTSSASITGASTVCAGSSTTLSNSTGGGAWTSSNTSLATVGSSSGIVSGVSAGAVTITYTIPNACFALQPMTVNPTPAAITGTFTVCTGLTTTLGDATGSGSWSSSNTGLASVGSASGIVTGNSAGVPTISYTLTATGCSAVQNVTVNTTPAIITGSSTVCIGQNTTLSDGTSGGTWSSSNPAIGSVGSVSGAVTGIASGNVTITYTVPNGCFVLQPMTVNPNPAAITGTFTVCTGTTTTLGDATGSGSWSSSNPGLASVGSASGIVTGNSAGIPTISYTLITGCFAIQTVTVNTSPLANSGSNTACVGATTTLSNSTGGGTWSSSNTAIATVGSGTGVVTGVATGTVNIDYTVPSGCVAITAMTVNPSPAAITGTFTVCTGTTTTLGDATSSGSWSSSNTGLASVGSGSGIVTGNAAGVPTISYTLSTGCYAIQAVTVNTSPATIGGPTNVCTGANITITDATSGGAWSSSSTGLATVGSSTGVVNGVSAGTPTMTYTALNGCIATEQITVNPSPAAIAGSGTICTGASTTLTDATVGGTWSSSDITKATIGASSGIVNGVAAGNVTMTYTLSTGCFSTFAMTVNVSPTAIAGTTNVCVGFTTTLSDAMGGGTWSSSNTSLATVGGTTGVVNGIASGVATISYIITATGCFNTTPVTVNANPAAIGGSPIVCVSSSIVLTDATTGGTWSSNNAGQATVGASTGVVTGVSAGNPVISYTLPTGCYITITATVNPLPNAISGTTSVCIGFTTTLADATTGGSWSSSNTAEGTVSGSGIVTGIATGTPTITYTLTTGCIATTSVTVNPNPAAITGTTNVCVGAYTSLFDATGSGLWTSGNPSFATVGAGSGTVNGVAAGTVNITYTLPTGCFALTPVTVNPNPVGITGTTNVCIGLTTTLADASTGGSWSSSNTAEGTVSGSGVVTGISAGTPIITYTLPTGCMAITPVTVNPLPAAITGSVNVCTGFTTTLADATTGGTWSSSSIGQATVGTGTGVVTGVSAGNPTITYTLPTGCNATKAITVNQTPVAIAGTMSVCIGLNTTLTDATTPSGTWSSSNTLQATVGSSSGIVNGVAAGNPLISYTMATGCFVTATVTVNPNPAAITGATAVCTGSTIGLADGTTGGTWSSSDATKATIGSGTGVVTGVAAGTPTITYTLSASGGCIAIYAITVNTTPSAITGTTGVCTGLTTTLADGTPGGNWSSSNTSEATIGSSSGVVNGLTTGTPIMSYTMGTGCFVTTTVTVNQTPVATTGTTSVCVGLTTVLSDATSGGAWTSSNTAQATVGSNTGVVTGVSVGTPNITYTMPTGCNVVTPITVNPTPASITGPTVVCVSSNITLSDATSSGVWSSGNTSTAIVGGGTGIVTGVAAGVVGITYSLGAGCFASYVITVNPVPNISNFTSTTATSPCVGGSATATIASTSLGTGTFTVTYNLSGANAVTGATATMTMGATTGTFTIPSGSLTSTGFTTVTVTQITNSLGCSSFPTSSNSSTFAVNALPTVYTVLGGGGYCSGGTGVHIYLSNSVGGVNYQLWLGSTAVGAPVAGTFSGLDFGAITTVGTYTVTAVNVTTGCGSNMAGSATVSVNPLPAVYTVTGGGSYCSGGTGVLVGLSNSTAAVNYQLYLGGVATGSPVAGTGFAISFGLQTAGGTYTVVATDAVTACTNNMTGSVTVTINPLPASITGTMFVCPGTTSTLSDATGGGTWSSSTPAVGTVGSTTGVVTGISAGTTIITYSITATGCLITATVTVNPNPAAIAGLTAVCVGSAITLTDATGGGTWTSSNTSLATINISTGVVSGVATGTPTMTYTLSTGCLTTYAITVNPTPASISGASNVCTGLTTTLTDATAGGTWTSSNSGIANIGSITGVVTGASAGTVTITYTLSASGGCTATAPFSVNPTPAAITGTVLVCAGLTTTLGDASGGGTWSSSNTSLATVGITSGVVSGIAAGTVTITYTLPAGCMATTPLTVNPTPAAITGVNNICLGLTTTLNDATSGGIWSSSNASIASVGSITGIVSGVATGAATITYTLSASGGCTAVFAVTVNPNPAAITGVINVCAGATTNLTDATTGGTWSSSNVTLGTVTPLTGVVTGIAAGTPIITYSLSTGCIATTPVTVNPLPASITGILTVCAGSNVTLSDASGSGTWTSSNTAVASVGSGSGVVTGVSAGNATITYTLSTGCLVTTNITVNPSPASIAGSTFVCVGQTTTLSDATSGGTWSSSNPALGSISVAGVVAGLAAGIPTITYSLGVCISTMAISVNPTPSAITGTLTVCAGATTNLSDASGGGNWTSSNTTVATAGASTGVISGVSAGNAIITYTLPGGCIATTPVTVNPSPASITGANNVCLGLTTTLTDAVSGGAWSSSNAAIGSIGTTGVVSGITAGSITITYTLPAGCLTAYAFTVNPLPLAITGVAVVCAGATTTLTDATSGGTWSSSAPTLGTIGSTSGIVSGISAGTVIITYTLPTTCLITMSVTVNPLPTVYTVTGGGAYCAGGTGSIVGLSNSQVGVNYQLYVNTGFGPTSTGSAVAGTGSLISFGLQTTAGTYTVVATNATTSCVNNMASSATVTINNLPTVYNMTGGGSYCSGGAGVPVGLNGSQTGVSYQLYNGSIPLGLPLSGSGSSITWGSITGSGIYTAIATYTVSACSSNMTGVSVVTVNPLPTAFTVTGGGSYCTGGTGVHIGLSGSTTGVNYTASNGVFSVTIPGTGSALDFGLFTSLGTYTVTATNPTTTCSNTMLSTALVSSTTPPAAFSISPASSTYCSGGTGAPITLSGSQSGVNYQLFLGASPMGSPVAGTGTGSISFGLQTAPTSPGIVYTAVATNTTSGCTTTMTGTATLTVNPLPVAQVITGGGSYCLGGTGVSIGLGNTVTGTNYQLYMGGSPVSGITAGTGLPLNFTGLFTTAGIYTVMATIVSTTCTVNMPGSVVVNVNPLPNLYSVTGGGNYCAGGAGLHVGLSSSDLGINYQLYLGTSTVGIPVPGTGSALDFGAFTAAGTYKVVGTNPLTGCTSNMSSSALITINPLPAAFPMTGGGSYCAGGIGDTVGISGSAIGVNYQLLVGVTPVGIPVLGTGLSINFGYMTAAGIYTVLATNITTGCTNTMSGLAVVVINPLPALNIVTGGGSYCIGGIGVPMGLNGSVSGVNYQVVDPNTGILIGAVVAGTGSSISFGNITVASLDTYVVVATNIFTGCNRTMTGSAIINPNPLPTLYTVTGGGGYCTGGTGVHIGLSSSDTGVSYQLVMGTTPLGIPVAGTGSSIDFGLQTAPATYTVVATNSTTTCSATMTGSVLVVINPLPAVFTVTGGGPYCPGGPGMVISLSGSVSGVNYQLYNGGSPVGALVTGSGIPISFGLQTAVGTYTVLAINAATTCTSLMSGTAVVSLYSLPTAYTVTGGGGYCLGGAGAIVGLSGSASGVTYQLYQGTTAVGMPVAGTGSAISFVPQTGLGVYTVVATNSTTSCTNVMTGSVTISLNPLPTAYTVTGGGGYCSGGAGVNVGLSHSDASVTYQLYLGGIIPVGSLLAGTGGAISFGLQTTAGTYTVLATNSVTGCTNNMTGSVTVMINPLPIVYMVTGGGSYCAGGAGRHIGLSVSDLGINYQLYNGVSTVGGTVAGTGIALDFGTFTAVGTYTVNAINASTGCASNMSGSVAITINPLPAVYVVTGGGSYCAGGIGQHVGLSGSVSGINYQLFNGASSVGGATAGTGSAIDFGLMTAAGTYTVVATNASTGCIISMTGSATITINPLPVVDTVTGGGNYCPGGTGVHIGLTSSTIGIHYQLFRGTTMIGLALTGTGSGLDFGLQTIAGTYFVVATDPVTGCSSNMAGSASVNISTPPTAYTVGVSASGYCAGGIGVHVTLSGSAIGTQYQLYRGTLLIGTPLSGTGFPLDYGLQTSAGTYSVVATDGTTGCTNNMTGTPSITINPLPSVFTVTGGGSYCAGGAGVHIYQSGSETGVNYQLMNGFATTGSPMAGTSYSLDFGAQTAGGTYTVIATNAVTGCTTPMLSSASININPLPVVYFVVGGGSYCSGDSGVHVAISGSDTGVTYQLFNGTTIVGGAMAGIGTTLDFGYQTLAGVYTVVATNATTGCTGTMSGSASVSIIPLPTSYSVIGGGNYCTGGTGVHIGLSGSASSGVSYQLLIGSIPTGTPLAGTGASLDFGLITVAGTYTVKATNTTTGCSAIMTGSTVVTISLLPTAYAVTGGGSYCASAAGAMVGLSGSDLGVNYQLYNGSVTVGGLLAGIGGALNFGLQPAGNYTVVAINATTSCTNSMTGSATVTVIPSVVPSVSITTGVGDTVCAGTSVTFTPLAVNGGGGPTYQWYVNGTLVSTGSSYNYIPVNGNIVSVTMTSNATCVSPATASNFVRMTVNTNVTPVVTIAVSPNDTVCQGTVVTFTPTAVYGGTAPVYAWYVNGVNMGAGSTFSYTPNNTDVVFTQMTSSYACVLTPTAISNNIVMTVDDNTAPTVTITNNSGANVGNVVYGDTLIAVVTNGGANTKYQWWINGIAIPGATNRIYLAGSLNNGDMVSVVVSKTNSCGTLTGNNTITIISTNVGVHTVNIAQSDIRLVPNPNKGIFTIKGTLGTTDDQEVSLEVTNMLGQVIYTAKFMAHNGILDQTVQLSNTLANGMYMLNVSSGAAHKVFHMVVEQ